LIKTEYHPRPQQITIAEMQITVCTASTMEGGKAKATVSLWLIAKTCSLALNQGLSS